jgi:anthranilate phosphoribosyltransferase
MIREAIEALVAGKSLTLDEASAVMREVMDGEATPAQIGSFVTALRVKGETSDEMAGMATIMREKALHVEVEGLTVDTAGTGGDAKGTFNISTAAAIVGAGAGVKMAKHGGRAASGVCGSADVLEAAGVKIDLGPEGVKRCIEQVGIGFMFAPTFHPAMRHAAPVRRELGIRTVFNVMGPLTNPAGAGGHVLGVPDPAWGERMAQVLRILGSTHAMVVHGEDGMDELTLAGPTRVWEVKDGQVRAGTVAPADVGLPRVTTDQIPGGNPAESADILRRLLDGEQGPLRQVVLLNAAAVLLVGGMVDDLASGVPIAEEAIDSGKAAKALSDLVKLSQELATE